MRVVNAHHVFSNGTNTKIACASSFIPVISNINRIVARWSDKRWVISWHVSLSGHDDIALSNDVSNNAESTKIDNNVIIVSLNRKPTSKLINRIPDLRLLTSSLLGSAL